MQVDSWELPLSAILLSQLLPCHLGPQRQSWLHHWSVPHVHTSGAFSPSEEGPDSQCNAAQVAHWICWWQYLVAWHCRVVWSLPYHSAADVGDLAMSMSKSPWHGALRSTHKSCACSHVSWKRGGGKRELAAAWTYSRRFSHMMWLKVHSRWLLRAFLLSSKRRLPPPACQVQLVLPSVVCYPRGVQFPGAMYICNQGPLSSAWVHCISYAPSACSYCRRCCCCTLQCHKRCMEMPELCRRSRPMPRVMSFIFPAFSLSPFSSIASFQVKSLLTLSSSNSAMIAWSSV